MTALLSLVAVLCILVGVATPFRLMAQARQDRAFYEQFRRAGVSAVAFERQHGNLPSDAALRRAVKFSPVDDLHSLRPPAPTLCGESFRAASNDQLVLWFWRGEWAECFAYPSGRTTLPRTVAAYLRGGLAMMLLLDWLVAVATLTAVVRIWLHRQRTPA